MKILIILGVILMPFTLDAQFWKLSTPIKLDGTVNTLYADESNAIFSEDSSLLYFTRTVDMNNSGKNTNQAIWVSKKVDNNKYSNDVLLEGLNNKYHNSVVGISQDGNSLYLLDTYKGRKDISKGISVSKFVDGVWTTPESILIPTLVIQGEYYYFHVNKSEDVIIISYNGPGSVGEEDLYVSTKVDSGWTAPIHMGNEINSIGYEISPFLTSNQDTLYFSSNGFGGEGDADVFYSVKQGSWSSWSTPINLGNVVNSDKFDAYYSCSGNQVMWSSNRDDVRSDIYVSTILPPPALIVSSSKVVDVTEFGGTDGSIDVVIEGGVGPFTVTWSNGLTSEDISTLKQGEYAVTITDSFNQTVTSSFVINEPEEPIVKPTRIRLPEVRYAFNKWELLTNDKINSTDSLLYVYDLLIEFPGMILELSSHTDSRGSVSVNQYLSENRARACYKFLVEEKGIDPRRIIPIGKGKSDPRVVWKRGNDYLLSQPKEMEGVQEIKLTESYINQVRQKDSELYKVLNQLNRRTEVRLISLEFDPDTMPAADPKYLKFVKR